ncbi:MAG: hypothetical protein Q8P97_00455 [bacterium]|nr:hypothetical protein [bacterium]
MDKGFFRKKIFNIEIVSKSLSDLNKMVEAIIYLRKKHPPYFSLTKKLKGVFVYPKLGYDNEFFPMEKVWVCELRTVRESSTIYLASLLVHEAVHLRQFESGIAKNTKKTELDAYQVQKKFLSKAGDKISAQWIMEQYKENWTRYHYKSSKQFFKPNKKFRIFLDRIGSFKK